MKVLRFILQKEFRQIFRDKTILVMMFALPTIQLIIIPLATNFDVKNINIVVVDNDHSSLTQELVTTISASGYFRVVDAVPSYKRALAYVEDGDADLVIEIPAQFERSLMREGWATIAVSVDAINGTRASIGGAYLNRIINLFNSNLRLQYTQLPAAPGPVIDVPVINRLNPLGAYTLYMVPGILVLLLTLIGGFISALNIVREKELGTIEQINVTPIKKWQFILGKMIPFWLIGMVVFTVGLLIARLLYGITPAGSLLLLYGFASIYLVALLGFGLLISTYSETQVQAMFVAFFFMMIFMLMSGLFTSADSMPRWARNISNLIPVTYFIKVVRMIVLNGSGFSDVLRPILYMIVFAVVLNGWAIWNYKKTT